MAHRPDPTRIAAARRAATIAGLVSAGRSPEVAAEVVAEWETGPGRSGRALDRADWDGFDGWLAARRPTRR
jgi:hypothetical protein